MLEQKYVTLVNVIKNKELSDDVHRSALEDLIRLFATHTKEDQNEALRYAKGAVLHLFKQGTLRGLTENLKGLKPTYLTIMHSITAEDMNKLSLSPDDTEAFFKLIDKLEHEIEFISYSNELQNEICAKGIEEDDVMYDLKEK